MNQLIDQKGVILVPPLHMLTLIDNRPFNPSNWQFEMRTVDPLHPRLHQTQLRHALELFLPLGVQVVVGLCGGQRHFGGEDAFLVQDLVAREFLLALSRDSQFGGCDGGVEQE